MFNVNYRPRLAQQLELWPLCFNSAVRARWCLSSKVLLVFYWWCLSKGPELARSQSAKLSHCSLNSRMTKWACPIQRSSALGEITRRFLQSGHRFREREGSGSTKFSTHLMCESRMTSRLNLGHLIFFQSTDVNKQHTEHGGWECGLQGWSPVWPLTHYPPWRRLPNLSAPASSTVKQVQWLPTSQHHCEK